MKPDALYHFSANPNLERFAPHVPRTNPSHLPAVWAIDAEHAPLYWFPRDCPRVTVWSRTPAEQIDFAARFETMASRIHALEAGWLERMRDAAIHRYTFDPATFVPWKEASGQWTSSVEVEPISVPPVGDLLAAHVGASIELRIVPSLWPLYDLVRHGEFDFSIVRIHNARPRSG